MADIKIRLGDECDDDGDGERGKRGHRGHHGATGPQGEPGTPGASAIIPFASGEPVLLAHSGLGDTGAVIGFGSSAASVGGVDVGVVDLTGAAAVPIDMAFSMPRDGTLSQLSVFYSNVLDASIPLGSIANVVIQLYRSTTPNNIFTAIPGALVTLPLPPAPTLGTIANGTVALSVPVSNQDRLLLVASLIVTGVDIATSVTGYVSAGLAIT